MLAADFVADRVPELVRLVREGGDALRQQEDPQGEPFTDYYPYVTVGGVYVPEACFSLPEGVLGGELELTVRTSHRWLGDLLSGAATEWTRFHALITRVLSDGAELAHADDFLARAVEGKRWTGRWARLTEPLGIEGPEIIAELVRLRPEFQQRRFKNGPDKSLELIGLVFPEETRQGVYEDAWLFILNIKGSKNSVRTALFRSLPASRRHFTDRIPELLPLARKTVALAGLGTLGSPIAHELARSSIGRVSLLDGDYTDSGTLPRWLLGFSSAGVDKPRALAAFLREQYPHVEVSSHQLHVGAVALERSGPSEAEELDEWLDHADMIIDATAESNVTSALYALAQTRGIPLVQTWSVEGYGGVVARHVPSQTGCPHCLALALSPDGGTIPPPTPPADPHRVQPRGCADPTFTAPAIDLIPLATETTRLSFGELCRDDDGGYPRPAYDVLTWQLRATDGSLLDRPDWKSYRLPPDPRCPVCEPASGL